MLLPGTYLTSQRLEAGQLVKIAVPCLHRKDITEEMLIHQRLQHSSVVSLMTTISYQGRLGLVLEFCESGSLEQLLRAHSACFIPETVARRYLTHLHAALEYVHLSGKGASVWCYERTPVRYGYFCLVLCTYACQVRVFLFGSRNVHLSGKKVLLFGVINIHLSGKKVLLFGVMSVHLSGTAVSVWCHERTPVRYGCCCLVSCTYTFQVRLLLFGIMNVHLSGTVVSVWCYECTPVRYVWGKRSLPFHFWCRYHS